MPLSVAYLSEKLAELRKTYQHAGDFCFFADAGNAAAILKRGALLSRRRAQNEGLLQLDCASTSVLSNTANWVKEHVRLYFAPKTPMLYNVEGIKRTNDGWPECPAPVYFVFKPDVLLLPEVKLSDGNLAAHETRWDEASDQSFSELPFKDIYHRGSLWRLDGRAITRRRHAEVLIPDELSLAHLQRLVFRSQAELKLCFELLGIVPDVLSEVEPSWFNGRLHLKTFETVPNLTATVANHVSGDSLVQVSRESDGQLQAYRSVFRWIPPLTLNWSPYESVELPTIALTTATLNDGRNRLYLNGRRVAIW